MEAQDRLFDPEPATPQYNIYARHTWITARTPMFKRQMFSGDISPAWLEWHWARGLDPGAPKRVPIPAKLRLAVIERDGYVCGLCAGDVGPDELHIDHVLPVACGGKNEFENLQVAHSFCNISKGARLPEGTC